MKKLYILLLLVMFYFGCGRDNKSIGNILSDSDTTLEGIVADRNNPSLPKIALFRVKKNGVPTEIKLSPAEKPIKGVKFDLKEIRVGEMIDGYLLREIRLNGVILEKDGKTAELKLPNPETFYPIAYYNEPKVKKQFK